MTVSNNCVRFYRSNMENYTNGDILNLFYIYGECNRVLDRACAAFNNRYPHLRPITKKSFRRIQNNFISTGTIIRKKNVPSNVTDNQDAQIDVMAYFNAYPNSSIRAASSDLGK